MIVEKGFSRSLHKTVYKQFIAYIFASGVAFVLNTIVLLLVRNYMLNIGYSVHMADAIGSILGFIIGLLTNYFLSLLFVFQSKSSMKDFTIVLIVGIIGLFMTSGGLILLNAYLGIPILLAQFIVTGIVFFWNFAARKLLVYKDR